MNMRHLYCRDFQRELPDWLDGSLPASRCGGMERHVQYCLACRQLLREERAWASLFQASAACLTDSPREGHLLPFRNSQPSPRRSRQPWAALAAGMLLACSALLALQWRNGPAQPAPAGDAEGGVRLMLAYLQDQQAAESLETSGAVFMAVYDPDRNLVHGLEVGRKPEREVLTMPVPAVFRDPGNGLHPLPPGQP